MRSSHTNFADALSHAVLLLFEGGQLAIRWTSLQLLRALLLTQRACSRRPR